MSLVGKIGEVGRDGCDLKPAREVFSGEVEAEFDGLLHVSLQLHKKYVLL